MWESTHHDLPGARVRKYQVTTAGRPLSCGELIAGWRSDPGFRAWFIALLAQSPYPAYFWETPPLSLTDLERAFEFVLLDSPALAACEAEPRPFEHHFRAAGPEQSVVSFPNLGSDAYLIAPCPRAAPSAYPHLGAFTREAPEDQQHALWRAVGAALEARLGMTPVWTSTAGLGVLWLHVRIDRQPKYYRYPPYRGWPLEN